MTSSLKATTKACARWTQSQKRWGMFPAQGEEWVIDTGVLARASNPSTETNLDAQAFVQNVRLSHHIAVDFQGHIRDEYSAM